ncbi:MAG: carbohydrate porin [Alphaproteobacteria bacterium]|nr:carbohydrate porin [Alphaproteobacteria bacterium]
MVKRLLFSLMLLLCVNHANASDGFKEDIENKYNVKFGVDGTYTLQSIKSQDVSRVFVTPYVRKIISDNSLGKTALDFSMNIVRFNNKIPVDVATQQGIATLFNSYDTDYNELYELYLSYTLPDNMMTLGLGQIPISKFDSPIASDLQRYYFLNSALAQNTTFTYPTAGIGGFSQFNLDKDIILSLGAIDASNPLANGVHVKDLSKFSSFASINYTPKFYDKYQASYSLLLYDKPKVENAAFQSQGWSLYLAQDISDKHSLFLRINGASSDYPVISKSYSFGVLFDNPFNRSQNDQLGLAYSINRVNEDATEDDVYDKYEHIIETYYDYKINDNLSLRPDLQVYLNQSFKEDSKPEAVISLSLGLSL